MQSPSSTHAVAPREAVPCLYAETLSAFANPPQVQAQSCVCDFATGMETVVYWTGGVPEVSPVLDSPVGSAKAAQSKQRLQHSHGALSASHRVRRSLSPGAFGAVIGTVPALVPGRRNVLTV